MKKKWFYIENYVYVNCISPDKVLLYNTINHDISTYQNNRIYSFVKKVKSIKNNGVIEIDLQSLIAEERELYDFIINVRNHYMGDFLPISENKQKPLLLQSNPMVLKEGRIYYDFGENTLFNLTEISFYITSKCLSGCSYCDQYNKQFLCCGKSMENNELPLNSIVDTLVELKESSLFKVNVLGGNIFTYTDFYLLVDSLNEFSIEKIYKINVKHLESNIDRVRFILENEKNKIELICTDLRDIKIIEDIVKKLDLKKIYFNFVVQSNIDLSETSELLFDNIKITPFYNGKNIDFFENEVFVTEDDLRNMSLDYKSIKRNILLNNHFFGSLICLSDGSVHADLNSEKLGNLGTSSISSMILSELQSKKSWLQVRHNVDPCRNCLYSCMCPPISNYEKIIGRYNVCTV